MSQVVIGDILPYTQATAISGQTVFGTNWTANYSTDVVVYQTPSGDVPDDATQELTSSEFSVSFVGSQQDIQVTLVTPANQGDIITITRQTPAARTNLYSNTNFTPSMLNNDFGILTLVDQQAQLVNQLIGPRYNYSAVITDVVDTILPILEANQTWVKNNSNTAIIATTLPASGAAPADDSYVLLSPDTANLPNSLALNTLSPGILVNVPGTPTLTITEVTGTTNQINVQNGNGVPGDIGLSIASNPIIPGTAGMGIPEGNTAQRIIPLSNISLRYNTDINALEFWNGSVWTTVSSNSEGFLPLSGGTMSGAINMGGNFINDLENPVLPQDAATKAYADSIAGGLNPQLAVQAASTANLNATYSNGSAGIGATLTNAGTLAALVIDGYTPNTGDRILVKNQTSALQNGIYNVTNPGSVSVAWILTRATDYDTTTQIQPGDWFAVENGTINAGSSWIQTATVTTIGTSSILFTAYFTPSNYLRSANNLSDLSSVSTARTNLGLGTAALENIAFFLQSANNLSDVASLATTLANLHSPFTKVNVQPFTSTGSFSYTPTTGTQFTLWFLQGGGAGSGGTTGAASESCVSGAGAGGGFLLLLVSGATNLANITGNVGIGGAGGLSGNNAGTAGGNTTLTINSGTPYSASGGTAGGGQTASGSAQESGTPGTGGTPTLGTNATVFLNLPGQNGGYGFSNGTNTLIIKSPPGGSSFLGKGGADTASGGSPGSNYGGGASGYFNGSGSNQAGLAGAQGFAGVIEFICS